MSNLNVCNPVAWRRLSAITQEHANRIGPCYIRMWPRPQISVPEAIEENCEILGSGDDERIKYRLHWYQTFHPELFASVLREIPGNV